MPTVARHSQRNRADHVRDLQGRKVLQVVVGVAHTMCVTADGLVFAFGFNRKGQLGVGGTKDRLLPTLLRGELGRGVSQLCKSHHVRAAGSRHTMFVTADGLVFACGNNNKGHW